MSYVLVAYSVVFVAAFGFALREWYSMNRLEKRKRHLRAGSKNET